MPNNNKLFLRELSSPYGDISRKRTLSFQDLDSNFIFLKGECINSMSIENGNVILNKNSGENMFIPISGISESRDSVTEDMISDLDSSLRKDIDDNRIWVWGSEGYKSVRVNNNSGTDATGDMSHAEGSNTRARGTASHAGGASSQANGDFSFAHTKGTSKADGESSVVLGGTLQVVENGGENGGIFAGDTNRILGLDYFKLIQDLENELNVNLAKRQSDNSHYMNSQNDISETISSKESEIEELSLHIEEIKSQINDLNIKLNQLNSQDIINSVIHQELTSAIESLEIKLKEKEELKKEREREIEALKIESNINKENESNAQKEYEDRKETIERLHDEYNTALNEFDGYLPKQSVIIGGTSNIINKASESIIDGGSGNTITTKVKNSGIFGGSENELGGGDYLNLIVRLEEELNQRAQEKAKYDADTEKLIKSLESNIDDKEEQLQDEKQQQPQDLALIATLEADIKELKEEKKALVEESSRNNANLSIPYATYETYVNETQKKIEEYKSKMFFDGENVTSTITPIDNSSIISGSGNKIIHLSDNSSIIGGKSNLIDNASGSVILGGEGITATNNNTVYTPNLNIDIQPSNDNSLTQVLVRDVDGNIKYKDVASFTDLSVVSGVYDIRTGKVTLINNDGDSFEIAGFSSGMTDSYTTEAYLEDKTIYFNSNIKGDKIYSVDISPILDDIITSIGYDDRGNCSSLNYATYESEVQNYYSSKESYDDKDSRIQTLTDEITELTTEVDTLRSELEFKTTDLIYAQITGESVEELQAIINQKQEDLDIKWANLEQKQLQKERDISDQQSIIDSGVLDFAPYAPANEANFNCWINQGIIDSVGYDDRGNCSGDRYEKYLSEYNDVLEYFNTSPPLAPPAFKEVPNLSDTITYNNLSTERQKLIDYWVEFTTYTNNLISSYELEITKYKTILDTLNAIAEPTQSEQDEIEGLVKLIDLLEDRKSSIESEYISEEKYYNNLIEWFDDNLSYLESTDEYNFIQKYTPINEVNFNCWNDSEDYNDLNSQITGITSAVGYDDRGACSNIQYTTYESEVQNYYSSKEVYDEYDSRIKTLTDEITQLNDDLINASTQQESDAISKLIEKKQVQKQSYVNSRQQIIDSGVLEFAPYVPANEANFNCYINGEQNDKIDTKTDKTLFNTYTSSTETIITGITSAVGYDDRGTCSEEQYAEYTTKVQEYYDLKTEYDEYDSNIKTLTDEITELTSDIDTLTSDINELKRTILIGKINGIDQTDNETQKAQKEKDLSSKWANLRSKQVKKERYVADRQQIIDYGVLDFASYVPANEVNFNCWSEQQIIDAVGYDDRGTCDDPTYHIYESLVDELKSSQIDYNKNIRELNKVTEVRTIENQKFLKEHNLISSDIDFYQSQLDIIKDNYESEGRDATPEELGKIAILELLINDLIKNREELVADEEEALKNYEELKSVYDEAIDDFESNVKPDIDRYLPSNEVNYNCWRNEYFFNVLDSRIQTIKNKVGYNDRGTCSEEQYAEYTSKVQEYYDSKTEYDEYNSTIQTLTDEISELGDSKTTKQDSLATKQNEQTDLKAGSDFINANYDYIITVSVGLDQDLQTIKSLIQGWGYGKAETEFLAEKTSVESVITSSLETWNTLNDLMVVNTTFNYQNKDSITSALTNIKNSLDSTQTILDTMSHTDTEEVFSQNKTDIVNHVDSAIQSSGEVQQNVTSAKDYYEQTNNDLDNEIQQLQAEIATISANIEQKQVQKQSYTDSRQEIINRGGLDFAPYVPANEANFNCYINSLQNDKVDNIITNTDYQIYNIESALNRFSDTPGTFNYYPNIHDDFTENPRFIIGEFDDLDNIINLDESSKITWASLLAYYMNAAYSSTNPENYSKLFNNLKQSIRCLEYLLSKINSIEDEKNAEFDKVKSDIDGDLHILNMMSEAPMDESDSKPFYVENIDRSVLQQRKQNLIDERSEEQSKFDYMEQKIEAALNVYEEIKTMSEMLLAEIESNL